MSDSEEQSSPRTFGPVRWLLRNRDERGGQLAIRYDGRELSHGQVYDAVLKRASLLRAAGVEAGKVVLIVTSNELEQRLFRWAAHFLNAIEAVVHPGTSHHEVHALHTKSQATVMVVDELQRVDCEQLLVPKEKTYQHPSHSLEIKFPGDSGRILFTTGSTGTSQAVYHRAHHLEAAARCNRIARRITSEDVLLCLLPAYHGAGSVFEDAVVRAGGALAIPNRNVSDWAVRAFAEFDGTITSALPSTLSQVLESETAKKRLQAIRLLNYAGEPITSSTLQNLLDNFKGKLTRGYGLTEAGPMVSVLSDEDHRKRPMEPNNLGRAAPGVKLRIDDGSGELLVRSPHVMECYFNDPLRTQETICDGWLRTGDIVSLKEGYYFLEGRANARIRSGGEWIHPSEIERVCNSFPGVLETCVVARPDARWGERPVAIMRVSGEMDTNAIHAHMTEHLARFKWPDWIDIVDEFPRLPAGKIDRQQLRQRVEGGSSLTAIRLPPRDSIA